MPNDNIQALDNTHGQRRKFDHIPNRGDDWVLKGAKLVPDWGDGDLFVGRALLCIAHNGTIYWVEMDGRGGLSIPSGTSGVYYDVANESVVVGSAPSEPTLKIGSVDASAQTTDETVNRDPTYDETITTDLSVLGLTNLPIVNVLNLTNPQAGDVAYHDGTSGSLTNVEGLACYNGTAWKSQIDNSEIS